MKKGKRRRKSERHEGEIGRKTGRKKRPQTPSAPNTDEAQKIKSQKPSNKAKESLQVEDKFDYEEYMKILKAKHMETRL